MLTKSITPHILIFSLTWRIKIEKRIAITTVWEPCHKFNFLLQGSDEQTSYLPRYTQKHYDEEPPGWISRWCRLWYLLDYAPKKGKWNEFFISCFHIFSSRNHLLKQKKRLHALKTDFIQYIFYFEISLYSRLSTYFVAVVGVSKWLRGLSPLSHRETK